MTVSSERVASLRDTFGGIKNHQSQLGKVGQNMLKTYAIINDGVTNAREINQQKFDQVNSTDVNSLPMLEKIKVEEQRNLFGRVIKKLDETRLDTEENYADLATQSVRIKNMEEATEQQLANLRRMHSQGIAGVADRLNTVLSAVFSAAGAEASAVADNTIRQMRKFTDEIAQKESIRIANEFGANNNRLMEIIEEVSAYKEINDHRNNMMKDYLQETKNIIEKLRESGEGVVKSVQASTTENALAENVVSEKKQEIKSSNDDPLANM